MPLAGVILAAGRSTRMGTPKALLDFRGAPFVVRILQALEALDLKTRVVVVGPDAGRIRPALATHDCLIVENPDVDGGPIASLRAALRALRSLSPAAALVWPVDLPHVRIATVQRLIETWRREGARAVLHAHAADIATVGVDDPAVIDDLNTPGDYERLVREVNRDAY